jgi:epoxyqueuosine reductase
MMDELKAWAKGKGRLAVLDMPALAEAGRFISGLRDAGELEDRFFRSNLAGIVGTALAPHRRWRSLILLSCPRPAHSLALGNGTRTLTCIIPPTYVEYRRFGGRLLRDLKASMGPGFPATVLLRAPLKRLAVRSGLASYGRNNITYSGEYGSYHQLVGLASEARLEPYCEGGPAAGPELPACGKCKACARRCPTGAIDGERFLLHAEKCFTLFSENPGKLPPVEERMAGEMPCLAGCMACQLACPANKGKLRVEPAPVSFTAEEGRRILADDGGHGGRGAKADPLWRSVQEKLKAIGMIHYQNRIGRNLRFMMAAGMRP